MKRHAAAPARGTLLQQDAHRLLRELLAATRAHQADVERVTGLPAAQIRLLTIVKRHPGCSVGECAALLGLSMPTVSNLLRELARRKWIRTVSDTEDRRKLRLRVTAAGAARIRGRIPFAGGMLNAVVDSLDEPSLRALATGLRALLARIPPGYCRRAAARRE